MKLLIVGEPSEIAKLLQGLATSELTVAGKVPGLDALTPPANAPDEPLKEPLNDTNAYKDGQHPWTALGRPREAK